jgi:phospholipase/lecithinase/hemolysin
MPARRVVLAASLLSVASFATAKGVQHGQIKNLVTFGDSYTDVGNPADGGNAWPVYAAMYGNFSLYPFAKSGATCSNNITYRPFPSLFESQLPAYFGEVSNGSLKLNPEETAYTLWIGTNDVGVNSLLVGQGSPGVSVVDTTSCAVNWVKTLYDNGARNFLFQNVSS